MCGTLRSVTDARRGAIDGGRPAREPGARSIAVMLVRATIQQIPPDNSGKHDLESRDIVIRDVATYEEGRDLAYAQVPDGWRVIGIGRW